MEVGYFRRTTTALSLGGVNISLQRLLDIDRAFSVAWSIWSLSLHISSFKLFTVGQLFA